MGSRDTNAPARNAVQLCLNDKRPASRSVRGISWALRAFHRALRSVLMIGLSGLAVAAYKGLLVLIGDPLIAVILLLLVTLHIIPLALPALRPLQPSRRGPVRGCSESYAKPEPLRRIDRVTGCVTWIAHDRTGPAIVTQTLVCGASRFSMSSGRFRENSFGNRFRESRSAVT